jgi:hypothetical protein
MTKITKSVAAAGSMLLLAQAAHAGFTQNDLVLGFTGAGASGVPNDYIIDLGNATSVVGVGGTAQVNLSSQVSQFNSVFTGGLNGLQVGAAGGINNQINATLYVSAFRNGGAGNPAMAGSPIPANSPYANTTAKSAAGSVNSMVTGLNLANPGSSWVVPFSDPNSWNTWVAPTFSSSSVFGILNYNPNGTATSSVIYEDLYKGVNSGGVAMNYVGYFTFDNTGASPSLTFTPSAFVPVPEPATYGMIAGLGLLLVSVRRQVGKA